MQEMKLGRQSFCSILGVAGGGSSSADGLTRTLICRFLETFVVQVCLKLADSVYLCVW